MFLGFVWIKILNDFSNIFGWKCNCRSVFVSNAINISRKRAIIRKKGALFRKENIKKLRFFLKISYETIFVKQWGIIGILLFKKIFNKNQYTL